MKTSNEVTGLFAALHTAQLEMPTVTASLMNDYYDSLYADLTVIVQEIRETLHKNGLSFVQGVQNPPFEGAHACLTTRIIHTSGQWIEDDGVPLIVTVDKKGKETAQQQGSAITYARRQGLSAMLGIVTDEDDDGANASQTLPSRVEPKADKESKPKPKGLQGPIKTMTELKKVSTILNGDIDACTKSDQFVALLATDETKALIDQLNLDWPAAHEKLVDKIEAKKKELG